MVKAHELLSDHKWVLNLKPLRDDKSKFRQWNITLANVLGQVNEAYEKALMNIMANIDQGKDADEGLNAISDPSARAGSEMVGRSEELPARSAGLSIKQVNDWFTNYRKRHWEQELVKAQALDFDDHSASSGSS